MLFTVELYINYPKSYKSKTEQENKAHNFREYVEFPATSQLPKVIQQKRNPPEPSSGGSESLRKSAKMHGVYNL